MFYTWYVTLLWRGQAAALRARLRAAAAAAAALDPYGGNDLRPQSYADVLRGRLERALLLGDPPQDLDDDRRPRRQNPEPAERNIETQVEQITYEENKPKMEAENVLIVQEVKTQAVPQYKIEVIEDTVQQYLHEPEVEMEIAQEAFETLRAPDVRGRSRSPDLSYAEILAQGLSRTVSSSREVTPQPQALQTEESRGPTREKERTPSRTERSPRRRSGSREGGLSRRPPARRPARGARPQDTRLSKKKKTPKRVMEVENFDDLEIDTENMNPTVQPHAIPETVAQTTKIYHSATVVETVVETSIDEESFSKPVSEKEDGNDRIKKKSKSQKKKKGSEDEIEKALKEIEEADKNKRKKHKESQEEKQPIDRVDVDSSEIIKNESQIIDVETNVKNKRKKGQRDAIYQENEVPVLDIDQTNIDSKPTKKKKSKKQMKISDEVSEPCVAEVTQNPNIAQITFDNVEQEICTKKINNKVGKNIENLQEDVKSKSDNLKDKTPDMITETPEISTTETIVESKSFDKSLESCKITQNLEKMDWNMMMEEDEEVAPDPILEQVASEVLILPENSDIATIETEKPEFDENPNDIIKEMKSPKTTSSNEKNNNGNRFSKTDNQTVTQNATESNVSVTKTTDTHTVYLITHEQKKLPPIRTVKMFSSKSNSVEESQPVIENLEKCTEIETNNTLEKKDEIESPQESAIVSQKQEEGIKVKPNTTGDNKLLITESELEHMMEEAIFGSVQDRRKVSSGKKNNKESTSIPYEELLDEVKTYSLNLDMNELDYNYYQYVISQRQSCANDNIIGGKIDTTSEEPQLVNEAEYRASMPKERPQTTSYDKNTVAKMIINETSNEINVNSISGARAEVEQKALEPRTSEIIQTSKPVHSRSLPPKEEAAVGFEYHQIKDAEHKFASLSSDIGENKSSVHISDPTNKINKAQSCNDHKKNEHQSKEIRISPSKEEVLAINYQEIQDAESELAKCSTMIQNIDSYEIKEQTAGISGEPNKFNEKHADKSNNANQSADKETPLQIFADIAPYHNYSEVRDAETRYAHYIISQIKKQIEENDLIASQESPTQLNLDYIKGADETLKSQVIQAKADVNDSSIDCNTTNVEQTIIDDTNNRIVLKEEAPRYNYSEYVDAEKRFALTYNKQLIEEEKSWNKNIVISNLNIVSEINIPEQSNVIEQDMDSSINLYNRNDTICDEKQEVKIVANKLPSNDLFNVTILDEPKYNYQDFSDAETSYATLITMKECQKQDDNKAPCNLEQDDNEIFVSKEILPNSLLVDDMPSSDIETDIKISVQTSEETLQAEEAKPCIEISKNQSNLETSGENLDLDEIASTSVLTAELEEKIGESFSLDNSSTITCTKLENNKVIELQAPKKAKETKPYIEISKNQNNLETFSDTQVKNVDVAEIVDTPLLGFEQKEQLEESLSLDNNTSITCIELERSEVTEPQASKETLQAKEAKLCEEVSNNQRNAKTVTDSLVKNVEEAKIASTPILAAEKEEQVQESSPLDKNTSISCSQLESSEVYLETEAINELKTDPRVEKSPIHNLHDLLPEIDSIPEFKPANLGSNILFSNLSADAPEFKPSYMYQLSSNTTNIASSQENQPIVLLSEDIHILPSSENIHESQDLIVTGDKIESTLSEDSKSKRKKKKKEKADKNCAKETTLPKQIPLSVEGSETELKTENTNIWAKLNEDGKSYADVLAEGLGVLNTEVLNPALPQSIELIQHTSDQIKTISVNKTKDVKIETDQKYTDSADIDMGNCSWADIVGAHQPSPDRIEQFETRPELPSLTPKAPLILIEPIQEDSHRVQVQVDEEGFIIVDRNLRSRSRSKDNRSRSTSHKGRDIRNKSENRFEPLTSSLKSGGVDVLLPHHENIQKERNSRKSTPNKDNNVNRTPSKSPAKTDNIKQVKKDKKKKGSKKLDVTDAQITLEHVQTSGDKEIEQILPCNTDKKELEKEAPDVKIDDSERNYETSDTNVTEKKKNKRKKKSKTAAIKKENNENLEKNITDGDNSSNVALETGVETIENPKEELQSTTKLPAVQSPSISDPSQTPIKDRLYSEAQFWKVEPGNLSNFDNVTKATAQTSRPMDEVDTKKNIAQEVENEKQTDEMSLEIEMADLQREIEEMLLPENDASLSDDTPQELSEMNIHLDYKNDDTLENLTPSLASPEFGDNLGDNICEVYSVVSNVKQDNVMYEINMDDEHVSISVIDSVLDETTTDDYQIEDSDSVKPMTPVEKNTPLETANKIVKLEEQNSTVHDYDNNLTILENTIDVTPTMHDANKHVPEIPTNIDFANITNNYLKSDNFWTHKFITDDAEKLLHCQNLDVPHLNTDTGKPSSLEENIYRDTTFWPEKHIYHDAEYQYYILMAEKSKTVPISFIEIDYKDENDKDKDPGGSSGHTSEEDEPKESRGSPFDSNYISMDLPGGICSWKDQSSYLSLETPSDSMMITLSEDTPQLKSDNAEEILTTGPFAPSPSALQEPVPAKPTTSLSAKDELSNDIETLLEEVKSIQTRLSDLPDESLDAMEMGLREGVDILEKCEEAAILLETKIMEFRNEPETEGLLGDLVTMKTRITRLLAQARQGLKTIQNAKEDIARQEKEIDEQRERIAKLDTWLETINNELSVTVNQSEVLTEEDIVKYIEIYERYIREYEEYEIILKSITVIRQDESSQPLKEKIILMQRSLEETKKLVIIEIKRLRHLLVQMKSALEIREDDISETDRTIDSTSMPEEVVSPREIETIKKEITIETTSETVPTVQESRPSQDKPAVQQDKKILAPLLDAPQTSTIDTQTGQSLMSDAPSVADKSVICKPELKQTHDISITCAPPQEIDTQTSEPLSQEKELLENIQVRQTVSEGHETIEIASRPVIREQKLDDQTLLIDAAYRTQDQNKDSKLTITHSLPQSFETVMVEPDETTTEVVVDADGTKRIIVKKVRKTLVSRQQILHEHQTDQMLPLEGESYSQITLKENKSSTATRLEDGSVQRVQYQTFGGQVVSSLPSGEVNIQEFTSKPDLAISIGEEMSPEQILQLAEGQGQTHIQTSSSGISAVVQQVTRRTVQTRRRIIRRVVIIDGKEHVTEEVIEEPDSVEVVEEQIPKVSIKVRGDGAVQFEEFDDGDDNNGNLPPSDPSKPVDSNVENQFTSDDKKGKPDDKFTLPLSTSQTQQSQNITSEFITSEAQHSEPQIKRTEKIAYSTESRELTPEEVKQITETLMPAGVESTATSVLEGVHHSMVQTSSTQTFVQKVTRKITRIRKRIIKHIQIIDGKEHVTEEVIEEPEEVEIFEDEPQISSHSTHEKDLKTVQKKVIRQVKIIDGKEYVTEQIVEEPDDVYISDSKIYSKTSEQEDLPEITEITEKEDSECFATQHEYFEGMPQIKTNDENLESVTEVTKDLLETESEHSSKLIEPTLQPVKQDIESKQSSEDHSSELQPIKKQRKKDKKKAKKNEVVKPTSVDIETNKKDLQSAQNQFASNTIVTEKSMESPSQDITQSTDDKHQLRYLVTEESHTDRNVVDQTQKLVENERLASAIDPTPLAREAQKISIEANIVSLDKLPKEDIQAITSNVAPKTDIECSVRVLPSEEDINVTQVKETTSEIYDLSQVAQFQQTTIDPKQLEEGGEIIIKKEGCEIEELPTEQQTSKPSEDTAFVTGAKDIIVDKTIKPSDDATVNTATSVMYDKSPEIVPESIKTIDKTENESQSEIFDTSQKHKIDTFVQEPVLASSAESKHDITKKDVCMLLEAERHDTNLKNRDKTPEKEKTVPGLQSQTVDVSLTVAATTLKPEAKVNLDMTIEETAITKKDINVDLPSKVLVTKEIISTLPAETGSAQTVPLKQERIKKKGKKGRKQPVIETNQEFVQPEQEMKEDVNVHEVKISPAETENNVTKSPVAEDKAQQENAVALKDTDVKISEPSVTVQDKPIVTEVIMKEDVNVHEVKISPAETENNVTKSPVAEDKAQQENAVALKDTDVKISEPSVTVQDKPIVTEVIMKDSEISLSSQPLEITSMQIESTPYLRNVSEKTDPKKLENIDLTAISDIHTVQKYAGEPKSGEQDTKYDVNLLLDAERQHSDAHGKDQTKEVAKPERTIDITMSITKTDANIKLEPKVQLDMKVETKESKVTNVVKKDIAVDLPSEVVKLESADKPNIPDFESKEEEHSTVTPKEPAKTKRKKKRKHGSAESESVDTDALTETDKSIAETNSSSLGHYVELPQVSVAESPKPTIEVLNTSQEQRKTPDEVEEIVSHEQTKWHVDPDSLSTTVSVTEEEQGYEAEELSLTTISPEKKKRQKKRKPHEVSEETTYPKITTDESDNTAAPTPAEEPIVPQRKSKNKKKEKKSSSKPKKQTSEDLSEKESDEIIESTKIGTQIDESSPRDESCHTISETTDVSTVKIVEECHVSSPETLTKEVSTTVTFPVPVVEKIAIEELSIQTSPEIKEESIIETMPTKPQTTDSELQTSPPPVLDILVQTMPVEEKEAITQTIETETISEKIEVSDTAMQTESPEKILQSEVTTQVISQDIMLPDNKFVQTSPVEEPKAEEQAPSTESVMMEIKEVQTSPSPPLVTGEKSTETVFETVESHIQTVQPETVDQETVTSPVVEKEITERSVQTPDVHLVSTFTQSDTSEPVSEVPKIIEQVQPENVEPVSEKETIDSSQQTSPRLDEPEKIQIVLKETETIDSTQQTSPRMYSEDSISTSTDEPYEVHLRAHISIPQTTNEFLENERQIEPPQSLAFDDKHKQKKKKNKKRGETLLYSPGSLSDPITTELSLSVTPTSDDLSSKDVSSIDEGISQLASPILHRDSVTSHRPTYSDVVQRSMSKSPSPSKSFLPYKSQKARLLDALEKRTQLTTSPNKIIQDDSMAVVLYQSPIQNSYDLVVDKELEELKYAIDSRNPAIVENRIIVVIETISIWLEEIHYKIERQTISGIKNTEERERLTAIQKHLERLKEIIYVTDVNEEIITLIETLTRQTDAVNILSSQSSVKVNEVEKEWSKFLEEVEKLSRSVEKVKSKFDETVLTDTPIHQKLEKLEQIESDNIDNNDTVQKLLRRGKALIEINPGREHYNKLYICNDDTKQIENAITIERDRLLQLTSLIEEYEQTLQDLGQITDVAEALLDDKIVVSDLDHLHEEIQKHRKFFVNLSHCRAILESLEDNLDNDTRAKYASLHNSLHDRATVIIDRAASRAQQMTLAASRWSVLTQGMKEEHQWLQVAQQRVPDLANVTSIDHEQYINLYQTISMDVSHHHAKILRLLSITETLQNLISCSGLENECSIALDILLKLQEDIDSRLTRLTAFKEHWMTYDRLVDRIEYWIRIASKEIEYITTDNITTTINLRKFWELKAQHEVYNNLKNESGNQFERALEILPVSDEMVQRQFFSKLEEKWRTLAQKIGDIHASAIQNISDRDVSSLEKLNILEEEIKELRNALDGLKGVIKSEDELNLYIERLQVMTSRMDRIQNELGRLSLLPTAESDRLGALRNQSGNLDDQISEELERSLLLKERIVQVQTGILRCQKNQRRTRLTLEECESAEILGSDVVERAAENCQKVLEDLELQWRDILALRQALHTLPISLRVCVSPTGLEKDISALQESHAALESSCNDLNSRLKSRAQLWRRFERQLEMVHSEVREADYMVELLTVQGQVDYDRLLKATEKLETLSESLTRRSGELVGELRDAAAPLENSTEPSVAAALRRELDGACAAYEQTKGNLTQLCDKYHKAVELWKRYRDAAAAVRAFTEFHEGKLHALRPDDALPAKQACLDQEARVTELRSLAARVAAETGSRALQADADALARRLQVVTGAVQALADLGEARQVARSKANGAKEQLCDMRQDLAPLHEDGEIVEDKLIALRQNLIALGKSEGDIAPAKAELPEIDRDVSEEHSIVRILELWQAMFRDTFLHYHRLSTALVRSGDAATALKLWNEYLIDLQSFLLGSVPADYENLTEHRRLCRVHRNLLASQKSVLVNENKEVKNGDLADKFDSLTNLHNETLSRIVERHDEVSSRISAWDDYRENYTELLRWLKEMEREKEKLQLRYVHIKRIHKILAKIQNLADKVPEGRRQSEKLFGNLKKVLEFTEDTYGASVRMEYAGIVKRVENLQASLDTWRDFLTRILGLISEYEKLSNDLQKQYSKTQDDITSHSDDERLSRPQLKKAIDRYTSIKTKIEKSETQIEALSVIQEQLKECLSPQDIRVVNQKIWQLRQQRSDLEHQLSIIIHRLQERLEIYVIFESRITRFVEWLTLVESRLETTTQSRDLGALDPQDLIRRLTSDVEAETALKEREFEWLSGTGSILVDLAKKDEKAYSKNTAKQLKDVQERWLRLQETGRNKIAKIHDLLDTIQQLEERLLRIRENLHTIETQLSTPVILLHLTAKAVDEKLKERDATHKQIESESGDVGETLNHCELIFNDPDVLGGNFDLRNLKTGYEIVEKKWKSICEMSEQRKATLREIRKAAELASSSLPKVEKKLEGIERRVEKVEARKQKGEEEDETIAQAIDRDLDAVEGDVGALEEAYARVAASRGAELRGAAAEGAARLRGVARGARGLLARLAAAGRDARRQLAAAHQRAVLALAEADVRLTRLMHLAPAPASAADTARELDSIESDLSECLALNTEADRLAQTLSSVPGVLEMQAEYKALYTDVRARLEVARAEMVTDVDSAVQVNTLKWETDASLQVDTLTPKDAYHTELISAVEESTKYLDELKLVLQIQLNDKTTADELANAAKEVARAGAKPAQPLEMAKHLSELLLTECDATEEEAMLKDVASLSMKYEDLLSQAKKRELEINNLRLPHSAAYALTCQHEAGRASCHLCTDRNWQQLDNDLWRLEQWLQFAEATDEARTDLPERYDALEDVIQDHREFLLDLDSHKSLLVSLNIVGAHVAAAAADARAAAALRERLARANRRWDAACARAAAAHAALQHALMNNQEFHDSVVELVSTLAAAERSVRSRSAISGEDALAAYARACALRDSLARAEPRVLALHDTAQLLKDPAPELCARLRELRLRLQSLRRVAAVYALKLGAALGAAPGAAQPLLDMSEDQIPPMDLPPIDEDGILPEESEEQQLTRLQKGLRFVSRVARASLPFQALLLLLLGAAALAPNASSDCRTIPSFQPVLRYPEGPPPL